MKVKLYAVSLLASTLFSLLSAVAPEVALDQLEKGNLRFIQDKLEHPNRTQESRTALKGHQTPFATIVGCSDSRVSPEILFDQGIGDLFVVRVAGNVVGPVELDSIDYASVHLGANLVLVLGHENCGAVKAVMAKQTGDIETIAAMIQPAVTQAAKEAGNDTENAIKMNVTMTVQQLKETPHIARLIADKKMMVVGGYYNLETGKVEILK